MIFYFCYNISTPWTIRYEFQYDLLNHIELGGILVQSMHIAANSGWHIGWPIHIAALQRWHIDCSIHIAALEQRHIGRPIHIAVLNRWNMFGQYIVLPTRQTYWSTNRYCCAYAMITYCSGNTYCYRRGKRINLSTSTYCCLRDKHIGRAIRIAARTRW